MIASWVYRVEVNKWGYRGVRFRSARPGKDRAHFEAWIGAGGRLHYLGRADTAVEAARLYDAGALRFHGPFAVLNFPVGG